MFIAIRSKTDNSDALEAARRYSPNIELIERNLLVFDLTGKNAAKRARCIAEKLFAKGHCSSVAASDNLAAALLLARQRPGVSFADGQNTKDLEEIPVEALDADREFRELMDSWGIGTLGEFRQLPEDKMVERFGQEIVAHRETASGSLYRAAAWNVKDNNFLWSRRLESEIKTIEPLNFVLSTGIREVFANLRYTGLSTQSSAITLSGRDGSKTYKVRIVFPTRNEKLWLRQMISKVELDPPGFGVGNVSAVFEPCKPRAVQNNLYSGAVLEPENLDLIVSKLKKVVGIEEIGLPKIRNSWRRGFYLTEDLSGLIRDVDRKPVSNCLPVFYYYTEPVETRIAFESGTPKALFVRGHARRVKTASGPWRMDAEWFAAERFVRDEWDLEMDDGALYRVAVKPRGESSIEGGWD